MALRIPVGTKVKSKAIGSKGEFEGVVVSYITAGNHIIRDLSDGSEWARDRYDLKINSRRK